MYDLGGQTLRPPIFAQLASKFGNAYSITLDAAIYTVSQDKFWGYNLKIRF